MLRDCLFEQTRLRWPMIVGLGENRPSRDSSPQWLLNKESCMGGKLAPAQSGPGEHVQAPAACSGARRTPWLKNLMQGDREVRACSAALSSVRGRDERAGSVEVIVGLFDSKT